MATQKKELTVEEKLKALYDLQQKLSEIDAIKTLRGELPQEVQDLEDEIAGLHTRVAKFQDEVAAQKEEIARNKDIKQQSEEDAAILRPYFLGYLVYYRVNCALNPYISYRCGFQTPGADLPERFEVYRNMFTTALDELFLKHCLNKTPAEMDIDKIFWVTYAELLEITRLYPLHLKRILGREISREDAIKAAQDMNRLAKKRIRPGMLSLTVPVYETFSKTV